MVGKNLGAENSHCWEIVLAESAWGEKRFNNEDFSV